MNTRIMGIALGLVIGLSLGGAYAMNSFRPTTQPTSTTLGIFKYCSAQVGQYVYQPLTIYVYNNSTKSDTVTKESVTGQGVNNNGGNTSTVSNTTITTISPSTWVTFQVTGTYQYDRTYTITLVDSYGVVTGSCVAHPPGFTTYPK